MSLGGWATRTAVKLVPRLSFRAASRVGRGLGTLVWAADSRHRRVADGDLRSAFPEMPPANRYRLVTRALQQAGGTSREMPWTPSIDVVRLDTLAATEALYRDAVEK